MHLRVLALSVELNAPEIRHTHTHTPTQRVVLLQILRVRDHILYSVVPYSSKDAAKRLCLALEPIQ